ncbi:MAG: peptide deformylase [Candidatus Brocadiia bacterium]
MELKKYPDEVLRVKCEPVREIHDEQAERMRQMLDFMYEVEGVGLAGPQVGWAERIVTIDVEQSGQGPRIFVNPKIVEFDGESEAEEGCLSLPGVRANVRRAERVTVSTYTLRGKKIEIEAEGLLARAWQHELDHLNGVLFIDRLEPSKVMSLKKDLRRLEGDIAEKADS